MVGAEGPRAMQMPAAGLSAESGAPLLPVVGAELPKATETLLRSLHHPAIYVMNTAHLSRNALGALAKLGRVTRIPESEGGEPATATNASIAAARFTDGTFGWGVKEPGHGLVFARSSRPLDAPAAALLSATGDYGPLLLLEAPEGIPPQMASYLADIQPAYSVRARIPPGARRLQSRLADRRRSCDLADHAGAARLVARDRAEQAGRGRRSDRAAGRIVRREPSEETA